MPDIRVTSGEPGKPDHVTLDGTVLEHATFQFRLDDRGVRYVVVRHMRGSIQVTEEFAVRDFAFTAGDSGKLEAASDESVVMAARRELVHWMYDQAEELRRDEPGMIPVTSRRRRETANALTTAIAHLAAYHMDGQQ